MAIFCFSQIHYRHLGDTISDDCELSFEIHGGEGVKEQYTRIL